LLDRRCRLRLGHWLGLCRDGSRFGLERASRSRIGGWRRFFDDAKGEEFRWRSVEPSTPTAAGATWAHSNAGRGGA
jgi:hypothetical protein